jgi:hypothetical protein
VALRKFDGKTYHSTGYFFKRASADRVAAFWKKKGYLYRIVREPISRHEPDRTMWNDFRVWAVYVKEAM